MSKLKNNYYRMFCMIVALMIIENKKNINKTTNDKISQLFGDHYDYRRSNG